MRLTMDISQAESHWVLEIKEWDESGLQWRDEVRVGSWIEIQEWVWDEVDR